MQTATFVACGHVRKLVRSFEHELFEDFHYE